MTAFSWRTSFSIAVILVELIQHAEHVVEEFAQYVTKRKSEPAPRNTSKKETANSLQTQRQARIWRNSYAAVLRTAIINGVLVVLGFELQFLIEIVWMCSSFEFLREYVNKQSATRIATLVIGENE